MSISNNALELKFKSCVDEYPFSLRKRSHPDSGVAFFNRDQRPEIGDVKAFSTLPSPISGL